MLRGRAVTSEVLNTNVFDYKWTYARRLPDAFAYHLHALVAVPAAYRHNRDSALLCHAEAAAFGGGAGVDLQLWQSPNDYRPEQRRALRETAARFFAFVRRHRRLYTGLRAYGEVGLVYHDLRPDSTRAPHDAVLDLATGLAARGVLWDVLTEERATLATFARYKALVYHEVERLSEAEASALVAFLRAGGVAIVSGSDPGRTDPFVGFTRFTVGMLDEHFRLRDARPSSVWPPVPLSGTAIEEHAVGAGRLVNIPAGALTADGTVAAIERFFRDRGTPRPLGVFPDLEGRARAHLRVAAWHTRGRLVVHVVNYDVPVGIAAGGEVRALHDVRLVLTLPAGRPPPSSVHLLTPEADGARGAVAFTDEGAGRISFVIPTLRIYAMALIR